MVTAEIVCIGDELLIGQVVNSNAAWIGQELELVGIKIIRHTAIGDIKNEIIKALDEALSRVDIVLMTGGLGPTKDDITKLTLCEYFNTKLVFDQRAFEDMERQFKLRGRTVSETNRAQAELPAAAIPIYNPAGTAAGMWFEKEGKVIVSMPGVPYEMKGMMSGQVIPDLLKKFSTPKIVHKTILTQGLGESYLSDRIASWEDALPPYMKLAYLPATGVVRLRLSAIGGNKNIEQEVSSQVEKLRPLIAEYIFGYDEERLEVIIGQLLKEKGKTLALAESCSGGYISHMVTSVPGSSSYYRGTIVPYSNDLKQKLLNIDPVHFTTVGAVSEEVAREMALHVKDLLKADYAISTTGIAGPGGATAEKPVGTVWIGIATPEGVVTRKVLLGNDRVRVIQVAGVTALNMLRKELLREQ
jgi:nicotinamide-nucleotide amidase